MSVNVQRLRTSRRANEAPGRALSTAEQAMMTGAATSKLEEPFDALQANRRNDHNTQDNPRRLRTSPGLKTSEDPIILRRGCKSKEGPVKRIGHRIAHTAPRGPGKNPSGTCMDPAWSVAGGINRAAACAPVSKTSILVRE